MTKRISFKNLVFILILLVSNEASSASLNCTMDKALYKPKATKPVGPLQYELRFRNLEPSSAMNSNNEFTLTTLKEHAALSHFKINYGCTTSGAITCSASYQYGQDADGKNLRKSLAVVGLGKEYEEMPIASVSQAPFVLIFPQLKQGLHYAHWDQMGEQIKYVTKDKIYPSIVPNVWFLSACNK